MSFHCLQDLHQNRACAFSDRVNEFLDIANAATVSAVSSVKN